ncbi:serine/threonine protein kinase [Micromonospora haikouensis]|uniref:non-specific serine/threonine protein kinase n=1 Tax=Micromonospora haikouensis TaxID=686309 RepID=A0A1C4VCD8_9ACTN|nr:serine/threonine-protein kinase [Micromonospora haikouensis]SCE81684.1 serine/threonine protein kinase [Micromonospora haikouensis]
MQIDQFLNGRYRLGDRIGKGGTAVVHRAYDELLEREVAVKVLLGSDRAARRRIRAEAKAAARLSHPNVTNVYDYGEALTHTGEPAPYVVMELLPGPTLARRLDDGPLPAVEGLRICAEVAAALAAAHARGLVHRDVKPANVVLTPSGAKVVDFGTAAAVGQPEIDFDGKLLGTPSYLAPERLDAGEVVPASDVYALGLLVHLVLTDELPWETDTPTQMLRAHVYVEPRPLPPVVGVPAEVAELCRRCLAKDPAARPSAEEAAARLAAVVTRMRAAEAARPEPTAAAAGDGPAGGGADRSGGADMSGAAGGSGGGAEAGSGDAPRGPAPRPAPRRDPARRRYRALLVVAAALVIAVATAGSLADSSRPHRSGAAGPTGSPVPSADEVVAPVGEVRPAGDVGVPAGDAGSPRPGDPARSPAPGGGAPGPSAPGGSGRSPSAAPSPSTSASPSAPDSGEDPAEPAPAEPPTVAVRASGGIVRVSCTGQSAAVTSTVPADGYQVEEYVPGPTREVRVVLGSAAHASDVRASCANGMVVPRVREIER